MLIRADDGVLVCTLKRVTARRFSLGYVTYLHSAVYGNNGIKMLVLRLSSGDKVLVLLSSEIPCAGASIKWETV